MWAKLQAHFGSGATWKDLAYLIVKLPLGIVSHHPADDVRGPWSFWLLAMPFFAIADVPIVNGTWVPPLWFGILCVPLGVLVFILALHVLNAWGWVCARWAEVMFRGAAAGRAGGAAGVPGGSGRSPRRCSRYRRPRPRRCSRRRRSRRPLPAAPAGRRPAQGAPDETADDETAS